MASLPTYLGTLGMTGLTAYFGLFDVGAMQDGETVLVSGAAGAVGSVVGQLAKIKGGTAVGIAGGPEKCAWLTEELGFDAAIDYRGEEKVCRALRRVCPDGVDVYFDNVGGEILDAALARLRRGARVPICGGISQYNVEGRPAGPANYLNLIAARARMEGFLVFDFADRFPARRRRDGRLDRRGEARQPRARRRGRRHRVPGDVPHAVPRWQHGQARPADRRGLIRVAG